MISRAIDCIRCMVMEAALQAQLAVDACCVHFARFSNDSNANFQRPPYQQPHCPDSMGPQPLDPTAPAFTPTSVRAKGSHSIPIYITTAREHDFDDSSCSSGSMTPTSDFLPPHLFQVERSKRQSPIPPKPVMCQLFNKPGSCRFGDKCRFVHGPCG